MRTMMFVERPQDKGRNVIGYQLSRDNYNLSPNGTIRIARYPGVFWIEKNHGYYGDIYMKQFIKKWKRKTYENIQRRVDRANAVEIMDQLGVVDFDKIVLEFL